MRVAGKTLAIILLGLGLGAFANADDDPRGGTWTKKNYGIKGAWSIVTTDEGRFIELDEKFRTRNAPDLKLFLSPLAAADLTNDNAVAGSKLISPLRSNKGAQRYRLPAGTDLDDYQTLVIHCERFSKLWGVSDLAVQDDAPGRD